MARKWKLPAIWALIALLLSTAITISLPNVGHHTQPVKSHKQYGRTSRVNGTRRLWDRSADSVQFDPRDMAPIPMWNKYRDKGRHLQCLMQATDKGAGFLMQDTRNPPSAASQFSGNWKDNYETWFWHPGDISQELRCDFRAQGLGRAFTALEVSDLPLVDDDGVDMKGNNFAYAIQHYDEYDLEDPENEMSEIKPLVDQKYRVDDKEYMATGAFYHIAVNEPDGALIALNVVSPATSVRSSFAWGRPAAPGELPELRFLSDMMWGFWVNDAVDVRNLRIYIAHHVINEETNQLVARAFNNIQVTGLAMWPGQAFDANTAEGQALIGSPIGAPIAMLLIQRKAELGIKQITRITIFTSDPNDPNGGGPDGFMYIAYEFEVVPQDQITPDNPQRKRLEKSDLMERKVEISQLRSSFNDSRLVYVQNDGRDILAVHTLRL